MIYTSYYAKIKDLPDNIIPISIAGKAPKGFKGLQYKKLAPKYSFFSVWKETKDNDYYVKCFNEQVLDKLIASNVVKELGYLCTGYLTENVDIALICYEKPSNFCHRHLVADWLIKNGYECEEYVYADK